MPPSRARRDTRHRHVSVQLTIGLARRISGKQDIVTFTTEVPELKRLVTTMEEREKQIEETIKGIEREWAGVGTLLKDVTLLCKLKQKEKAARKTRWKIVMEKTNKGDTRVVGSAIQAKGISTRAMLEPGRNLLVITSAWRVIFAFQFGPSGLSPKKFETSNGGRQLTAFTGSVRLHSSATFSPAQHQTQKLTRDAGLDSVGSTQGKIQ